MNRAVGGVTVRDIEQLHARLARAGDPRDVPAARDSLVQVPCIDPIGS